MRLAGWAKLLAIQAAICLVLLEGACQVYYSYWGGAQFDTLRNSPRYFYEGSDDPVLVYELARGKQVVNEGRLLKINRRGLREDGDDLYADRRRRVCLLGDSVAFGYDLSQDETIAPALQRQLDPEIERVKFLNCGVPGYSFGEMAEWLKKVHRTYQITDAIYLLNLNDFSRRDTMYEGADNGLYRMFHRPRLMLPFFVGKAIYRYYKGPHLTSIAWYRWLYSGNRDWGFEKIDELKRAAADNHIRLAIAILPAGVAYTKDGYVLANEEAEISAYLKAAGLTQFALTSGMSSNDIEESDHPTPEGLKTMAALVSRFVGQWLPAD